MNKKTIAILLILAAAVVYAQSPESEYPLKYIEWRIDAITKLILCTLWAITAGILAIVVIISGIKYLTAEDLDERAKEKKNIIHGGVGLIIIIVACPFVNYVVHDTNVKEFKCDCIPLPAPTSTTSTTTTVTTYRPTTTKRTTTTTTTTTTVVTVTTKPSGGRFLMVGNNKFYTYSGTPYKPNDLEGVIFNTDGSIYKQPFYIDNDDGPAALAVGKNRFFIAYGAKAVLLDWEGKTIKEIFVTLNDYYPVRAVHVKERFYLLLSPSQGPSGAVIQVYDLQGNRLKSFNTGIDKIAKATENNYGSSMLCDDKQKKPGVHVTIPEGDMAYGDGKLFIVWWSEADKKVYGQVHNLDGGKIKERFVIKDVEAANCSRMMNVASETPESSVEPCKWVTLTYSYVNPQIAAGIKNFMVMADGGLYLYDLGSAKLTSQKTFFLEPAEYVGMPACVDDIAYGNGDGKFLAVKGNYAKFYDEDGNEVGKGEFGGHEDQLTQLAYGNKMYVGVVAIHMNGDGVGASFVDSGGKHVVDVMPLEMSESPGWPAYDW